MQDKSQSTAAGSTQPTASEPAANWIPIAHILRPQGRKGEVLADLLTDRDLDDQFRAGRVISLSPPNSTKTPQHPIQITIENHWLPTGKNAGRIVLKLSGCDSIDQAELLSRQQIMVPVSELPALDEDTFYVSDLIGCTLYDAKTPVGTIVDVQFAMSPDGKTRLPDAAPLLGLHPLNAPAGTDLILIPFVRAHLDSVDLAAKRITMHLPPGLLNADPGEPSE